MVFVMSWGGVLNTILQELHLLGLLYVIDCDARKLKYKTGLLGNRQKTCSN